MVSEESFFLFEEEKLFIFCNDYSEGIRGVGMEKQISDCNGPLFVRMRLSFARTSDYLKNYFVMIGGFSQIIEIVAYSLLIQFEVQLFIVEIIAYFYVSLFILSHTER